MRIAIKFKKETKETNIQILRKKEYEINESSFGYVWINFKHIYCDKDSLTIENTEFKNYSNYTVYFREIIDFEIQE